MVRSLSRLYPWLLQWLIPCPEPLSRVVPRREGWIKTKSSCSSAIPREVDALIGEDLILIILKDIYKKNRHSGQPMAIKNIDSLEFSGPDPLVKLPLQSWKPLCAKGFLMKLLGSLFKKLNIFSLIQTNLLLLLQHLMVKLHLMQFSCAYHFHQKCLPLNQKHHLQL